MKRKAECTTTKGEECPVHGKKECPDMVKEAVRIPAKTGNIIMVVLNGEAKYMIKMFFPSVKVPSRKESTRSDRNSLSWR